MKKMILGGFAIVAIAVAIAFSVNVNSKGNGLSNISLENVEALANMKPSCTGDKVELSNGGTMCKCILTTSCQDTTGCK